MERNTEQTGSLFSGSKKHLKKIEVYEEWIRRPAGIPILMAEARLAQKFKLSLSTIRRYIRDIADNGYQPPIKPKQGRQVYAWDREALEFLKGLYIASQHELGYGTMRNAYNKTAETARLKGWKIGSEQSAYTHLRDIHSLLLTYASGGTRALDNIFYIARDLSLLAPFQVVVGDQHIFDFWTAYNGRYIRPECYLWLDMRTRLVYGIDFEPGSYNHRNVARALRMGIVRFGKFNSTYNDNGTAEKSGKIDRLVNALQTYGMNFKDVSELYRTREGEYAVEDTAGKVIATVENAQEWRRENRRMYAQVKNAKAKPIERFFRTLEVLLQDMCLPGYVRDITLPAAENEEADRRLRYQKDKGFIFSYEEFIGKVKEAIIIYENRSHAGLNRSPLEELRLAREREGWEPNRIDENDIRHIFLEQEKRIVKGNRIQIAGSNYVGPALTREMIRENRNDLAGLSGMKVEVYYDPDDPAAGAWAMDPRSGQPIYLSPETRIHPFNTEALSDQMAQKRSSIKAVTGTYRETIAVAGKVLTAPTYKPLIESQAAAEKAAADKTARAAAMTDEGFTAAVAVASRLAQEQDDRAKHQTVYHTPMKRYEAILDAVMQGGALSGDDRLFKADYETRMGEAEKKRWEFYINFNRGANHGSE